ncbi:MAG: metallophosphoesterase [bacterium]|nr:metallophosphoesterase [bacterium]
MLVQKKKLLKTIIIFALCFILFITYIFLIEPNRLEKTYLIIETDRFPENSPPIKIIHLTDFHIDKIGWREKRVLKILASEEPDLIFLSGDYLNRKDKLKELTEYIRSISDIAPIYFTLGNWDTLATQEAVIKGGGVSVFEKKLKVHPVPGNNFEFNIFSIKYNWAYIGESNEKRRLDELLKDLDKEYFTIFLAHTPDHFPFAIEHDIDLMLAGHTHGGQFRLPFFGSFYTDSKFGKKYEKGYFKERNTILYVNRGIGMTGNIKFRVRSFCSPEILIITLKSKKK